MATQGNIVRALLSAGMAMGLVACGGRVLSSPEDGGARAEGGSNDQEAAAIDSTSNVKGDANASTDSLDGASSDSMTIDSAHRVDAGASICSGRGMFGPFTSFVAPYEPVSVSTGDFNADGKLDLAVGGLIVPLPGGTSVSGVTVLLGNGDGTFAPAGAYGSANAASSSMVITEDFNGDGILDLAMPDIVSRFATGQVDVLLGNSDGTFKAAASYGAGVTPIAGGAADFDGDGHLDLAIANYDGNDVTILLGIGDGTFKGGASFATETQPSSLAVGDFNADGKRDLAVTNWGSNSVSILLGKGDGSFGAAMSYGAGDEPGSLTAGDFNGDGNLDLAVTDYAASSPKPRHHVSVLLGNGDGTFEAAVPYGVGSGPSMVATGDLDGDGRLDLVVANGQSNNVSVLIGNGDGTFKSVVEYGLNTIPGSFPGGVALGDFNGNGKLDLAVPDAFGGVLVLLNDGTCAP